MKKYLLFSGYNYYPNGGGENFVKSFKSKKKATKRGLKLQEGNSDVWFNILNLETEKTTQGPQNSYGPNN